MPDFSQYFDHIGHSDLPKPTLDCLVGLHRSQATTIPFENLDVLADIPISLEPAALLDKLVRRNRGGYCFELNGLLSAVLRSVGFEVNDHLARVLLSAEGPQAYPLTHQVLTVKHSDRTWLCDVGFGGGGLLEPMLLEPGSVVKQGVHEFRIQEFGEHGYLLQRRGDNGWSNSYCFTLQQYYKPDFLVANHFTATHADSLFRLFRFVNLPTMDGSLSIHGNQFIEQKELARTVVEIHSGRQLKQLLTSRFGINSRNLPEKTGADSWS